MKVCDKIKLSLEVTWYETKKPFAPSRLSYPTRAYLANNPSLDNFSTTRERDQFINKLADAIAEEAGVNLPYWQKQLRWTWNKLAFNWGDVKGVLVTDAGAKPTFAASGGSSGLKLRALLIVLQFFPDTLMIVGAAYFFVFLSLLMDDLIVTLGVVVIFAYLLGVIVLLLDIAYIIIDPRIRYTILTPPQNPRGRLVTRRTPFLRLPRIRISLPRFSPRLWIKDLREWISWTVLPILNELRRNPASLLSLGLIGVLVVLAALAPVLYPYEDLGKLWHKEITPYKTRPELARPVWFNWFLQNDLPENVILDSRTTPQIKTVTQNEETVVSNFTYTFAVPDGGFPQDVYLYIYTQNAEKEPFMVVTWFTPDGREFKLKNSAVQNGEVYDLGENIPQSYLDDRYRGLSFCLGGTGEPPNRVLFADPQLEELQPVGGTYQLIAEVIAFNPDAQVDVDFVLLGKAYGWAGTDHLRRELGVGLLWGLPIALGIGTLGAVTTSLLAMFIAAGAVWLGGLADTLMQRMTEVNMMLPILAVGVLLAVYFEISLWTVLAIAVLLNAFGGSTRTFRAAFLQV